MSINFHGGADAAERVEMRFDEISSRVGDTAPADSSDQALLEFSRAPGTAG
jgi:hypothetical protein